MRAAASWPAGGVARRVIALRRRGRLCGGLMFVEESAEPVATMQAVKRKRIGALLALVYRRRCRERWPLLEGAVRTMAVVVVGGDVEHVLEVAAADK